MKSTFAETLAVLRTQRNYTVQELADRAKVPPTLISGLQTSHRHIGENNARKIGVALGLMDAELEAFVYQAINGCTEKVLDECRAFPAEVLNLAARHLCRNGFKAEHVTKCVLRPKLKDGREPDAAVFTSDGRMAFLEIKLSTR